MNEQVWVRIEICLNEANLEVFLIKITNNSMVRLHGVYQQVKIPQSLCTLCPIFYGIQFINTSNEFTYNLDTWHSANFCSHPFESCRTA